MFESKFAPLAPKTVFYRRMLTGAGISALIVAGSLLMGTLGYHYFGGTDWIDALLNAAMILTGMGPVTLMRTVSGKLFSTFYALYSGIAFLTLVGFLAAPIYHRFLHKFHLELEEQ